MKLITILALLTLASCASKVVMKNCIEADNSFFVCEKP